MFARVQLDQAVVVCHSEPGAWNAPKPRYPTTLCPPGAVAIHSDADVIMPTDEEPLYTVGRTMFETVSFMHEAGSREV